MLERLLLDEARPPVTAARFFFLSCLLIVCAAPSAAADLRGFVGEGPYDTLLFQPCEGTKASARAYRLDDMTPASALSAGFLSVRKIMHAPNRPVYIEFAGQAGGSTITAKRFQRALGTVIACSPAPRDMAPGSRIAAAGEQPAWRFSAASGGAQLDIAGAKPVRFPAAPFTRPIVEKNARIYDAWSSQDGGSIRLEIIEELCSDGRSESAYGARVLIRYGSLSLEGCAARF